MQNILSKHLEKIRDNAESKTDQGTVFEKVVKIYLEEDKIQMQHYDKVWRYKDWAKDHDLDPSDTGIDLIAKISDGSGFCAIQCKFFDKDTSLTKKMLDSFLGKVDNPIITRVIIADTTLPEYSKHLETALNEKRKSWHRITLDDLDNSSVDWNIHIKDREGDFKKPAPLKKRRPHQIEAIEKVKAHFNTNKETRGQMIMACGTGKTFTSLCIAEDMGGKDKMVLYMVPSLALMSQTVLEWKYDTTNDFHAFSVCSDSNVGTTNDDSLQLPIHDLAFPATTNAKTLAEQVKNAPKDKMIVIFATYQSIEVLTDAQKLGLPEFDLIICDEAHRTTGAKKLGKDDSHFVQIHKDEYVKGKKRLYMTATPRIFGEKARATAEENDIIISTMDDEKIFGKEIHRLDFHAAVKADLLTDYKVIILAVDEDLISSSLQTRLATNNLIKLDDATKIVGCYKALTKQNLKKDIYDDEKPMKRAVAFCQSIKISKNIAKYFDDTVDDYLKYEKNKDHKHDRLRIEADHVDGTFSGKERTKLIKWLDEELEETEEDTCRLLTNVRCLSEGVDVPALDSIIFMHPRKSQIDVVQSVGRVMRKATGKRMGYVILPVVVTEGADPATALNNDKSYKVVWQILNALRTHDERFNAIINQIRMEKDVSDKIEILGVVRDVGGGENEAVTVDISNASSTQTSFKFDEFHEAILAKILKNCGTSKYWDTWTHKVARIAEIHIKRITHIIENEGEEQTAFNAFLKEIKAGLNDDIKAEDAVEMLAQHMITKPVFDILFKDNEFTKHNAVSKAMEVVLGKLGQHNLDKETDGLQGFYESVKTDATGLDDAKGRQDLVKRLYEQFFYKAFPILTKKLGIVYTPVEVVDFIIHSVNDVLESEFKTDLGAEGVHILDPFTGTGTFITRLLQSRFITPEQMEHKYTKEIHANEIVLLAYYIAAINIESVYHDKAKKHAGGVEVPYTPFDGIVLTDTFQLHEPVQKDMNEEWSPDNSKRRKKQKALDIRVIMGNPPYSAGQKSANDNAKNTKYKNLDAKIRSTYAENSNAVLQRKLYDSYIRAIRWASDRITENGSKRGIVAYVSNAGWVDGNAMDGLRKSLAEEFSSLYIFHLRGNINKNMMSKIAGEGGNIFGSGSKAGIAISVLVRNPDAKEFGKIHFHDIHDIGDNLKTDEKLEKIAKLKSIDGITNSGNGWEIIQPDKYNDWINQRDLSFENHISIGNKKDKKATTIFTNYSLGVSTNRDSWVYNASRKTLANNIKKMIEFYDSEVKRFASDGAGKNLDSFVNTDPTKISWTRGLKKNLENKKTTSFDSKKIVISHYRPFQKQSFYFDTFLNEVVSQIPQIFPNSTIKNFAIMIKGNWSGEGQLALMTDCVPCSQPDGGSQCFPLKLYDVPPTAKGLWNSNTTDYTKSDGISNDGFAHFQVAYPSETFTKEDLFYYIYGLLHSPQYRNKFKNNLSRELPRIPAVKTFADFWAFSQAGRELGKLHVNYENEELYDGVTIDYKKQPDSFIKDPAENAKFYRVKKMEFKGTGENKDKTIVRYNANITIKGIPLNAYEYIINGRPALEWVMNRQCVKPDEDSQIINDANDYANETENNPAYPLQLFQRVITVSLKTMEIIDTLPDLDID